MVCPFAVFALVVGTRRAICRHETTVDASDGLREARSMPLLMRLTVRSPQTTNRASRRSVLVRLATDNTLDQLRVIRYQADLREPRCQRRPVLVHGEDATKER